MKNPTVLQANVTVKNVGRAPQLIRPYGLEPVRLTVGESFTADFDGDEMRAMEAAPGHFALSMYAVTPAPLVEKPVKHDVIRQRAPRRRK